MAPPLDRFSSGYEEMQRRRIELTRVRIAQQNSTLNNGRIIPDPADLPIGRGRRIDASVLFLDISGFTNRPSGTASEQGDQVRVLSLFFSEIIRVVGDFGGTVEKNTGDGIMAYFARDGANGADVGHQALVCATYIFHAIDKFVNPIIIRSGLEEIRFRICIDRGPVTIARLGAARRFNHIVAVGSVANRTSKMLRHADPGDLLLGDSVLAGLPAQWVQDHVSLKTSETGWTYHDGRSYGFWAFTGRWPI